MLRRLGEPRCEIWDTPVSWLNISLRVPDYAGIRRKLDELKDLEQLQKHQGSEAGRLDGVERETRRR